MVFVVHEDQVKILFGCGGSDNLDIEVLRIH